MRRNWLCVETLNFFRQLDLHEPRHATCELATFMDQLIAHRSQCISQRKRFDGDIGARRVTSDPRWSATFIALVALLALTLMVGCVLPRARHAPDGVQLTPLKTYSRFANRVRLRLVGVSGVGTAYDVDCYRMLYRTHDDSGQFIKVSGLFALPRGAEARQLVSFQHGTTTRRTDVPSQLDTTGEAAAVIFAGNGYAPNRA